MKIGTTQTLLLPLCMVIAMATGCQGHEDAGNEAGVVEADDETCTSPPFAEVLPADKAIQGKPLQSRTCDRFGGSAFYGTISKNGDRQGCDYTLNDVDAKPPAGTSALGMDDLFEKRRTVGLAMIKGTINFVTKTRDEALKDPVILNAIGGPQYLPVVDKTSTGDTYYISLPDRDRGPMAEGLHAVIRDRYLLDIECTTPVSTHDEAKALYAPWLASLHLSQLP